MKKKFYIINKKVILWNILFLIKLNKLYIIIFNIIILGIIKNIAGTGPYKFPIKIIKSVVDLINIINNYYFFHISYFLNSL